MPMVSIEKVLDDAQRLRRHHAAAVVVLVAALLVLALAPR